MKYSLTRNIQRPPSTPQRHSAAQPPNSDPKYTAETRNTQRGNGLQPRNTRNTRKVALYICKKVLLDLRDFEQLHCDGRRENSPSPCLLTLRKDSGGKARPHPRRNYSVGEKLALR